jgi:uncharacterized membrane protein YcaP (DUF421 family)
MMNPVVRGVLIYVFLVIIFRFIGKRSLSQSTTFDLVLLLIISEVTEQGLVGEDHSITGSIILISTLIGVDLLLSKIKNRFSLFEKVAEGMPIIIVDHGKPLDKRMEKTRVEAEDVMEAARVKHGLERMDQIKYAVVEKNGDISIIPFEKN